MLGGFCQCFIESSNRISTNWQTVGLLYQKRKISNVCGYQILSMYWGISYIPLKVK